MTGPVRRRTIGICVDACSMGGDNTAAAEYTGLGGCGNRRLAVVFRGEHGAIAACRLFVLSLESGRWRMLFVGCRLFGRGGLSGGAARTSVIADAIDRRIVVDDGGVVRIMDDCRVHVGHSGVVAVDAAVPRATDKPNSGVSKPVINSPIEADVRPPIPSVPHVDNTSPAPIARSPEHANRRGHHPRAGNPVISERTISPVAWRPDISRAGANRLRINGKSRGTDADGNTDSDLCF